jgi:hypothetical protein
MATQPGKTTWPVAEAWRSTGSARGGRWSVVADKLSSWPMNVRSVVADPEDSGPSPADNRSNPRG